MVSRSMVFHFPIVLTLAIVLLIAIDTPRVSAQTNNGVFTNRAVGGVSISPEGVLSLPAETDRRLLRDAIAKGLAKPSGELAARTELRRVSLKGIEAAIAEAHASGKPLSDEVRYLAGLQRIEYVLLYPELGDIVLAGPGEGWQVEAGGAIVGITTGLPVIQLEDLAVALRSSEEARTKKHGGITCSIDPSAAGLRRFEQVVQQAAGRMQPGVVEALEKALGPQQISVTGVPETSHFARVLVAADYRMKRYAMELDKAPVAGLPSFVGLLKSKRGGLDNMLPRWWLACNYEPLVKSDDGLAFGLRGAGVKVMTESDFVEGGKVKRSGKANPVAQQWADAFTSKYPALSAKDPVFGELRNLMDLCVIAALLHREDWPARLKLPLTGLMGTADATNTASSTDATASRDTTGGGGLALTEYHAPKQVASQCSVTKSGRDYIITASGGVDVDAWATVENMQTDSTLDTLRTKHPPANDQTQTAFWWN